MGRWFTKIKKKRTLGKAGSTDAANPLEAPTKTDLSPKAGHSAQGTPGLPTGLLDLEPPEARGDSADDVSDAATPADQSKPDRARAVQSSKAIYKQLMSSFYDAILIADNKGHIIDNNQRAVEFFGYSNEELWDMPVARLVSGLNESVYERIRRAIDSERFVLMNTRCVRMDGSRFPAEVGISVVALLGQDDFVFTVRNVERRLTQMRSLRSGQNAFLNAQAGCFVCDAERKIVATNAAFLALLRIPSDRALAGVSIGLLLPAVAEAFDRVVAGEAAAFESQGPAGTSAFCIQLAPNHQGSSRIEGLVGSILPVSGIARDPAPAEQNAG